MLKRSEKHPRARTLLPPAIFCFPAGLFSFRRGPQSLYSSVALQIFPQQTATRFRTSHVQLSESYSCDMADRTHTKLWQIKDKLRP